MSTKPTRLLVIDDNPDYGVVIQAAIQQRLPNVQHTLVQTEAEAVTFLENCRHDDRAVPTLILLDLYLPDRETGWRLLDKIKTMSAVLGKVPVVLLSASTNRADIREAYQRGCTSYLVKPVTFDDWLAYFQTLHSYWWGIATLPKATVSLF